MSENWPRLATADAGKPIAKTAADFAVGVIVFYRDVNHRVYFDGKISNRHCYVASEIIGETRSSWINSAGKWDKKTLEYRGEPYGISGGLMGLVEAEDRIWIAENGQRISKALGGANVEQLRAIDAILSDPHQSRRDE